MIRLILSCAVVLTTALLVTLSATAAPAEAPGEPGIMCQERDDPDWRPRDDRPDPDEERPDPDREKWEKEHRERMAELRREIDRLHSDADKAKKHGKHDQAQELLREAKQLERKLHELERQDRRGPRPEMPPPLDPEKVEELKREIEEIRREAHEAKERGDHEEAEDLMREAEALERKLHARKGPPPEHDFSKEEIEEVLEWLQEHEPETLEKLERLREHEPGAYYHILRELFEKMRHMAKLRERDPEGYKRMVGIRKLDREIWKLAGEYKDADSEKAKEKIAAQLKEALAKLFDLKQAQHKAEIAELEREIAKLREIYKHNQEHKEKIVAERLKKLTGKNHDFDW